MKKILVILCMILPTLPMKAQLSVKSVQWDEFLSQHDLVWDTIPPDYYAGAILGNGLMGVNIYGTDKQKAYRWDIGRSDVTENRDGDEVLFYKARLPIGHFTLEPAGRTVTEEMRLHLYDAIAKGQITTEGGSITFSTYVDANQNVICIETSATGSERDFNWNWHYGKATSPRVLVPDAMTKAPEAYAKNPNPEPEFTQRGNINMAIQRLQSGYVYATAWSEERNGDNRRILATVSYESSYEKAVKVAEETIGGYKAQGKETAWKQHKEWWHAYYPASFATFPDAKIESFYWIQQYKFACLTRQDKLIIDLMGPWTAATPWPAIWWNLNVQLTYSPLFTANRLELSEPLWRSLNDNLDVLIANVPVKEWQADAAGIGRSSSYDLISPLRTNLVKENQYETGNLTWTLFYYWQYCTYKADEKELIQRFYPLLKRSIAYYSHILSRSGDGKYHLPMTASPEYKAAEDCNYDLALLRWGIKTLLDINDRYKLKDPLRKHWKDIEANLVEYPVDEEEGFMIGKDVKLAASHRHYSHLLMIYPLHLVTPDTKENKELIERSLRHWMSMKAALQGYSFTGSSSIYSILGQGEESVESIGQLIKRFIRPNTLYREAGPVVETPLAAVASIQETYLQSWGGRIRIFPSVPDKWADMSFINLRAEGGFLVSAVRKDARTALVQVESTAGGKCIIQTGMNASGLRVQSATTGKQVSYKTIDSNGGVIEINTRRGDIIQITTGAAGVPASFYSLHKPEERNYFGVRKAAQVRRQ